MMKNVLFCHASKMAFASEIASFLPYFESNSIPNCPRPSKPCCRLANGTMQFDQAYVVFLSIPVLKYKYISPWIYGEVAQLLRGSKRREECGCAGQPNNNSASGSSVVHLGNSLVFGCFSISALDSLQAVHRPLSMRYVESLLCRHGFVAVLASLEG